MTDDRLPRGLGKRSRAGEVSLVLLVSISIVSCCSTTEREHTGRMLSEVRSDLADRQVGAAVKRVAAMIERLPDSAATVRAFTLVGMHLDQRTIEILKKEDGPASVRLQLEILETYRARWLSLASRVYDDIVKAGKLIDAKGLIDERVLGDSGPGAARLLGVYLEQGFVFYELAKSGDRSQAESALMVCSNILRVTELNTEHWWYAKYLMGLVLLMRSKESERDLRLARVWVKHLELSHPNFDADRFGMSDRFLTLKDAIQQETVQNVPEKKK